MTKDTYNCVQCFAPNLRDYDSVCSIVCGKRWSTRMTLAGMHIRSVTSSDLRKAKYVYWGTTDKGQVIVYCGEYSADEL